MRRRPAHRRGFALADAIIGGVILALGLAGLLSLTGRAMKQAQKGEEALVAATLLDELVSLVLITGPEEFPRKYDTFGSYEPPFERFTYEVFLDDEGEGHPFKLTVVVRSDSGNQFQVQTLITQREGEEPDPLRTPLEILDREGRYDEQEASSF
jgi:hypothetical protein